MSEGERFWFGGTPSLSLIIGHMLSWQCMCLGSEGGGRFWFGGVSNWGKSSTPSVSLAAT